MSPLWRDQIQVFLAPDRVELVRSYRGIKPRLGPKVVAACERDPDLPPCDDAPLGRTQLSPV